MEGGIKPWRRQKRPKEGQYFDIDVLKRPLPPLPAGSSWERHEDGLYYIVEAFEMKVVGTKSQAMSEWQEHVVLPSDTLAGLSLRYGVKRRALQSLNFLEKDLELKGRATLKIPVKNGQHKQEETREVTLQRVRNASGLGKIEAEIYLEAAGWDLAAALASVKADDEFESAYCPPPPVVVGVAVARDDVVVVHLDRARDLRDRGVLQTMDLYVVAIVTHAADDELTRARSSRTSCTDGRTWPWSPAQQGSTIELSDQLVMLLDDGALAIRFELYAPNDLLSDSLVGSTRVIPLAKLNDGALHSMSVDSGGELRISLTSPPRFRSEFVRAVAVKKQAPQNKNNPFLPPPPQPPSCEESNHHHHVVTAVAIRVDDGLPASHPP